MSADPSDVELAKYADAAEALVASWPPPAPEVVEKVAAIVRATEQQESA